MWAFWTWGRKPAIRPFRHGISSRHGHGDRHRSAVEGRRGQGAECPGAEVGSQHADEGGLGRQLGLRRQRFSKDPETGQERDSGDSGDFISVSNVATATLDLPINMKTMESRLFVAPSM